jgi:nucleoside-diphosphate-sugar epimerase
MRVLITGAAGYVGSILINALESIDEVDAIVGIDLKPKPDRLAGAKKVAWIQGDVSTDDWQAAARDHRIDAVVHLAFQIRQLYGRRKGIQRRWNVEGACKVIAFALGEPSVRRLIHFSTVTAYGAHKNNSVAERLREKAPLTECDYRYGSHKREIEQLLEDAHATSPRPLRPWALRHRLDPDRSVTVPTLRPRRFWTPVPARRRHRGNCSSPADRSIKGCIRSIQRLA